MNKALIRLKAYKAVGCILAILALPGTLLILARDTPPQGGEAESVWLAIPFGLLGAMGLYVFIAVDRVLKRYEKAGEEIPPDLAVTFDWKALIVVVCVFAILQAIVFLISD